MKKITYALALTVLAAILWSCKKDVDETMDNPRQLDMSVLKVDYTDLINNANFGGWNTINTSNARVALGRALFYDTKLSLNNTVSCGSCHKQQFAFADNIAFSDGFKGVNALRNSQPIQNLNTMSGTLFWDGRADSLGQLVTMPISNHIEMGFVKLGNLPAKLMETSYYPQLFQEAYGSNDISVAKIGHALRDFLTIIVSHNTRFEQLTNPNFGGGFSGINIWTQNPPPGLNATELMGFNLFIGKANCSNCHSGNSLDGWDGANTGLDLSYADKGMGAFDHVSEGKFRIPALRNVELTAPYMHDGRFKTLEEVVDFYDSGIQNHPGLDYRLRDLPGNILNGGFEGDLFFGPLGQPIIVGDNGEQLDLTTFAPKRLNLTAQEKKSLIAFLKTLTDRSFITETRFSNPFRH